jgi:methyl-accepting chemotaxis protein
MARLPKGNQMSKLSRKINALQGCFAGCILASSLALSLFLNAMVSPSAFSGVAIALMIFAAVVGIFLGEQGFTQLARKLSAAEIAESQLILREQAVDQSQAMNALALENVFAKVMITNSSNEILHINGSLKTLFEEKESDIQMLMSDFAVSSIQGFNMDSFEAFSKPVANRADANRQVATITLFGLTLRTTTTKLLSEVDGSVNHIVEWEDLTNELAAQKFAEANLRSKYALEVCQANVMLADNDMNIVFANASVTDMLKARESELAEAIPSLNISYLVGTCVDDFHKNPSHQRGMIANLTAPHKARLPVNGLTFDLTATPIFDDEGTRMGTVVEWQDLTDSLAKQEQEQQLADANARVLQALDSAKSNVMLADTDNKIIYMNKTVTEMFKKSEHSIREALPHFDSSNLIGQKMDIFHKNPNHQQRVVADLSSTIDTDAKVGGLTFRITTSPLKNEQGKRIGTVVEWLDRTPELRVEDEVKSIIQAAVEGDLSRRIGLEDKEGFFASLGSGMNNLLELFGEMIDNIKSSAELVSSGAEEISIGNTNLSQRTEEQASSLEQTASSMEQMTSTVQQNAENARDADKLALAAREKATHGGKVVSSAISAMAEINAASKRIADIIGVIDEIAFQTNLLALNASVEAARAGEQGRGFAVVASEVRNLAGRSATAAKEIKELIQDSVGKVDEGSKLVNESGKTLEEIIAEVQKVTNVVGEISAASAEQASGINEVNKAITQMDEMTQQNAALVEEAAAASEIMGEQAKELKQQVDFFRTQQVSKQAAVAASNSNRRSNERPWSAQNTAQAAPGKPSIAAKSKFKPAPVVSLETSKKASSSGSEWEEF